MKKIKGFTLLECIIAMAIIGITSMLMVQVYGTVARMTKDNNMMNNSIERQMQYAEKQLEEVASSSADNGVVKVRRLSSYDHGTGVVGSVHKIKIRQDTAPSGSGFTVGKNSDVQAEIDLYVIGIETEQAAAASEYGNSSGVESYDDNNMRYKFIKPKEHP